MMAVVELTDEVEGGDIDVAAVVLVLSAVVLVALTDEVDT
jgi:hypothetical protein